jgi:hypothetical protein
MSNLVRQEEQPKRRAVRLYDSLVGFALQLNLADFLVESLINAGLESEEIKDLFDEEQYYGMPELLDGKAQYLTQRECRKDFVIDLIEGKFLESRDMIETYGTYESAYLIAINTGTYYYDLNDVILEVNSAFGHNTIPGGWYEGGEIRIVPGVDFNPWVYDERRERKLDMRDWLFDDVEMAQ